MSDEEDASISEINILPDGRVCLFGASQQVLEVLDAIPLGDPALRTRIDCLHAAESAPAAAPNCVGPGQHGRAAASREIMKP